MFGSTEENEHPVVEYAWSLRHSEDVVEAIENSEFARLAASQRSVLFVTEDGAEYCCLATDGAVCTVVEVVRDELTEGVEGVYSVAQADAGVLIDALKQALDLTAREAAADLAAAKALKQIVELYASAVAQRAIRAESAQVARGPIAD